MKFITVRDLRARSAQIWEQLSKEQNMVITSNGRPLALLTSVNEDTLEDTLAALRRTRAVMAVSRLQEQSVAAKRDRISDEDIEAEIKAARRNRERC